MLEFASILNAVETLRAASSSEAAVSRSAGSPILPGDAAPPQAAPAERSLVHATLAYAEASAPTAPPAAASRHDAAAAELRALVARLDDPALSAKELRALRRRLAWRSHPDRLGAETMPELQLAQINARIDRALSAKAPQRRGARES